MNKLFYFLFCADILAGAVLSLLFNLTLGIVTALILIFINAVTFINIRKIQKNQKGGEKNETEKQLRKI